MPRKSPDRVVLDDNWTKRVPRPETGFVEYTDQAIPGYQARVFSERIVGSLRYTPLGSSARKRMPLGEYPSITMAEMRRRAEAVRGRARDGEDPVADREAIREERQKKEAELDLTGLVELYEPALKTRKSSWSQDIG